MLPTKEDVNLACEFYRQKMTEDEAVDRVSHDIVMAYGSLTSIKVNKKSVKNGVKTIRLRRLQRAKELSIDKRTGDMREDSGKKRKGKGKGQDQELLRLGKDIVLLSQGRGRSYKGQALASGLQTASGVSWLAGLLSGP